MSLCHCVSMSLCVTVSVSLCVYVPVCHRVCVTVCLCHCVSPCLCHCVCVTVCLFHCVSPCLCYCVSVSLCVTVSVSPCLCHCVSRSLPTCPVHTISSPTQSAEHKHSRYPFSLPLYTKSRITPSETPPHPYSIPYLISEHLQCKIIIKKVIVNFAKCSSPGVSVVLPEYTRANA